VTDIARSETKPNNAIVETNKPGWDSNVGSTLRRDTVCSLKIFPKIALKVAFEIQTLACLFFSIVITSKPFNFSR